MVTVDRVIFEASEYTRGRLFDMATETPLDADVRVEWRPASSLFMLQRYAWLGGAAGWVCVAAITRDDIDNADMFTRPKRAFDYAQRLIERAVAGEIPVNGDIPPE